MTPLGKIRRGAAVLGIISLVAIVGHRLLTGRPLLESLYWFVVTVSSVGYSWNANISPAAQAFTIVVIVVGMTAAVYTLGGFLQLLAEGEVERVLGVRRMSRQIDQLAGHVIICGYGRFGKILAEELAARHCHFVIVDQNIDAVGEAQGQGYLALVGDAMDEQVLKTAGIERAKTVIVGLPTDANNVFLTLTARNLNRHLKILARGEQPTTEQKLLQAGADRVVLPAAIGARRVASMVTRPHATDMLDLVTDHRSLDADIEEYEVAEGSALAGKTVREVAAREKYHLLFIAVRRRPGEMIFNPEPDLEGV